MRPITLLPALLLTLPACNGRAPAFHRSLEPTAEKALIKSKRNALRSWSAPRR